MAKRGVLAYFVVVKVRRKKKRKKSKKVLTSGGGFSILSKRSKEPPKNWKAGRPKAEVVRRQAKKVLDKRF